MLTSECMPQYCLMHAAMHMHALGDLYAIDIASALYHPRACSIKAQVAIQDCFLIIT